MRTRRNWIAVIAMLAITVAVVPLAAAVADDEPAAAENEVHGYYYLALGDSVPAGTRQPRPFTRHGYPTCC